MCRKRRSAAAELLSECSVRLEELQSEAATATLTFHNHTDQVVTDHPSFLAAANRLTIAHRPTAANKLVAPIAVRSHTVADAADAAHPVAAWRLSAFQPSALSGIDCEAVGPLAEVTVDLCLTLLTEAENEGKSSVITITRICVCR